MEAGSNLFPNSLFLAYPIFFAFFRRVGRFRFSGVKGRGLGQTRFYGENTTCNEMEVWRLSSKRISTPTFPPIKARTTFATDNEQPTPT